MPGRGAHIETDFRVAIDRVFKGPPDIRRIVVSEMGGAVGQLHLIMQFPLLQPGSRYVLFVYDEKRPGVPPVAGLSRYQAEIFYGTFLVSDEKLQTFFRDPFGGFTGMTVDSFASEISAQLR
jgi:hypothetical protein